MSVFDADSEVFWDGCRRGVLLLQRCSRCQHYRYPPSPICQSCLSPNHEWLQASGAGKLFSFAIVHRALDRHWKGEVPYVVAVVELSEGPHLLTNLTGIALDGIEIGMPLEAVFEPLSNEITVPRFRAAKATG